MASHTYATALTWHGSTGEGYGTYSRDHDVTAAPAEQTISLSADPSFRGDAARLNPEQLVVAAASSCQLLSFLAVAARAGLDVVAYDDDATAVMDLAADPPRLTSIDLHPSSPSPRPTSTGPPRCSHRRTSSATSPTRS